MARCTYKVDGFTDNYYLRLTITDIEMADSRETNCTKDYVEVFDGKGFYSHFVSCFTFSYLKKKLIFYDGFNHNGFSQMYFGVRKELFPFACCPRQVRISYTFVCTNSFSIHVPPTHMIPRDKIVLMGN